MTPDKLREALRLLSATAYTHDEIRKLTPDQLRAALGVWPQVSKREKQLENTRPDRLRQALRLLTVTAYTDDEIRKMTPDQLRAALLRLAEVNSLKNNSRT